MAGTDRATLDNLMAQLAREPYNFDFCQAVRRLEGAYPDQPPVGYAQHPAEEPVRFGQEPSLAFAAAAIASFEPPGRRRTARMLVNFFGLLGPNGPLPLHLTEYVYERSWQHRDQTLAAFLDVFHHRLLTFFYRAWAVNRQEVNFERGKYDRFAVYVASLIGMGMASFRNRDEVPDLAKLHYAGQLAGHTRHPSGLAAILADYFGIAVTVQEFSGQWIDLPPECQCRLGASPATGLLGRTVVVGSRVWDVQQKFRLRLGRMGFADYQRMLPGGASFARLEAWVRNYVGDAFGWEVQLVLKKEEVPAAALGKVGQMGWSTWLTSKPLDHDAEDLIVR